MYFGDTGSIIETPNKESIMQEFMIQAYSVTDKHLHSFIAYGDKAQAMKQAREYLQDAARHAGTYAVISRALPKPADYVGQQWREVATIQRKG